MAENRFIPSDDDVNQNLESNSVNERNNQEYQNLMERSQRKYLIAAVGAAYYIILWFRNS